MMKTKRFLMILLAILVMAGCNKTETEPEPEPEVPQVPSIPPEDFPDENFYKYLLENFDADKDGIISLEEAGNVKQINAFGHYFESLDGFEHFPNLEKLYLEKVYGGESVYFNLDLSKNAALTELNITNAKIKTLDVTGSPLLKVLRANSSNIETLDVSHNTQLEILDISYNYIDNIDLSKNVALKELYCIRSMKSGMTYMKMTELDVSANVLLEVLNCGGNNLEKIDVTKNPKLRELDISESKNITFLNLTQNNELRKLNTTNTQVPFLDIKHTQIDTLYCCTNNSNLLTLDAKGSRTLKMLECNFVGRLDVSESSIETIVFRGIKDPLIKEMTFLLNDCPNLKEYHYQSIRTYPRYSEEISGGYISLDISNCPSLTKFYSNALERIKIENCPALKELTCKGSFENINLSGNVGIEKAYVYTSYLPTINLKDCASLTDLYCHGYFESIDLSNNKNIRRLTLMNNKLTSLNIDALTDLEHLDIAIAPFDETLSITKNIKLEELIVRDCDFPNFNTGEIKQLHVAGLPRLKSLRNTASLVEVRIENCETLESISSERGSYTPGKLAVENCPNLRKVYYSKHNLADVVIRECENIDSLSISGGLESFRYGGEKLTYLNCSYNNLTSLDISGCTGLKELDCQYNAISSLTMNGCLNIETIRCEHNQIPALAVGSLSKLRNLYCSENRLTSLDISKNPAIDKLDCSANPDLATLYINQMQNFSVFKKDGQTEIIYMD